MAPMTSRRPVSAPDDAEELADTSLWQLAGRFRGGEEEVQPASSYQGFSMRAKELVRNSSLSFGPRNHHRGAGAEESNNPDGDHGAAAAAGMHHDGFLSRRRQTSMDISSLEVLITKTGYQEPYYMETMHSPSSEILHPMRSLFLDRISGASPTELPPVRKDKQTEVVSSVPPQEHYTNNTDEHDPSSPPVLYFSEFPELKTRREKIVEEEEEAIVVEPVAAATEQESGEPGAAAGQKGFSGGGDGGPPADAPPSIPNIVVMVVYDAEKKPTTTGLDYAINTIVKEGDEIIVVGYLQHVMSPMGHKMLADTTKFIGVNEKCLKGEMVERKQLVEKMILNSGRGRICAKKKVNLSTRIVPGALPRVIVVQEAESLHAAWVIFDRNAMKEKKMYYSEHLKCHVLRIKSDGCSTETIRSLGPTPGPATFADSVLSASFTSSESSSSTDHSSISNMSHEFSPSIWSRFKSFGSRRSSSVNHQQSTSVTSSSTQSSPHTLVLSSTPEDTEYIISSIPTINEFSFDSPNQKSMLNSAAKLKAFYLGEDTNIPQRDGAA
ncbi:hypothetical protein BDL97_08G064500 [Sphagnum fallax]|nr:hypothetical protein BDL97_08G064500 [Sphagnum fallax]